MRTIRPLSPDVVSKIAAGEVIERPGSAVKELLENSLDAGAGSIIVDVAEGGRDLVRIVDDGHGIPREELPLAVAAHATSKLIGADDLFRIRSFGFRGEALNAIAGVSDFTIRSRPEEQEVGALLEVHHGHPDDVRDTACPRGTQIEIRNLFASVPVRRKFLKSKQTEFGHVAEAMIRTALANPDVGFRLVHNERVVHDRPRTASLRETIGVFFGDRLADKLVPIDAERDGIRLHGFVGDPSLDRPNSRGQYLFVNRRYIRDRSLSHAISEAFRGLLMTGRYPVAFLFFEMPSDQVDVNVHPTKIEVRFENPHQMYSHLLASIRNEFLSSDLTATLRAPAPKSEAPATSESSAATSTDGSAEARRSLNREFSLSSAPANSPSLWDAPATPTESSPPRESATPSPVARRTAPPAPSRSEPSTWEPPTTREPLNPENGQSAAADADEPSIADSSLPAEPQPTVETFHAPQGDDRPRHRALQIHNSYIIAETDDGMLLIDQHALHERMLYEEFRRRVAEQAVETQELLVPEPIDVTPTQLGLLLEQRAVLQRLGLRIDEFGERCVLVQSVPTLLSRAKLEELVREIAHRLEETGRVPSRDELLEDLLHLAACKAAVKAGDPLTDEEIQQLMRRRHLVDDSHHCPHGRPTMLRFSLQELEKQFKRI
ncbi:DNA mismatch repair protein MutL [Planctomycetes bacterium Pan216]|uniref:DNA mismatch repair protein MutL n=1 Tax=Kolteria novifilia TaxID=2527975 RepID=A0A518BBX7_9BACT|nr:DNA mismatch repair protein MutL [Planctomycetes bacterium Pan216]